MHKIQKIIAREILDSRGNPAVEADVILSASSADAFGRASVPSGKSTGKNEAVALKASRAVENVNNKIAEILIGVDASDQREIDNKMIELDGTENKKQFRSKRHFGSFSGNGKKRLLFQKTFLFLNT